MIAAMPISAEPRAPFDALPAADSTHRHSDAARLGERVIGPLVLHELDNDLAGLDGSANEAASLVERLVMQLAP